MLESGEMNLETIYVLSKKSQNVRGIDIAEEMCFSKPSVSRAVGLLKKNVLVFVEEGGSIRLTPEGEKEARQIYERHTVLTKLFIALGVDEETAVNDACRIEHYMSDKTFNALKAHLRKCGPKM